MEFGRLSQQQQEWSHSLFALLVAAIFLVFMASLIELRSFYEPVAILPLLGAIIGIGVVAKNGILMLDVVRRFELKRDNLEDAVAESGQRGLRPVLITSLATELSLLQLAYVGAGSDMLKLLTIGVIGALKPEVRLSPVAPPPCMLSGEYLSIVRKPFHAHPDC